MRKIILSVLFVVLVNLVSQAQCTAPSNGQYFGNDATICAGSYSNISWNATITIAAGTVSLTNPTFNSGKLVVKSGATLTITAAAFSSNGVVTIENGATLNVSGSFTVNGGKLDVQAGGSLNTGKLILNGNNTLKGSVLVGGITEINNGNNVFSSCSQLTTATLLIHNNNLVSGSGFIKITSIYNNEGSSSWIGHPLTASSNIYVQYMGAPTGFTFGSAHLSGSNNNPCTLSLPIKFKAIRVTPVDKKTVKVEFDVEEASGINIYNVKVGYDGINYQTVAVVFPDDTKPNTTYSVIVKLK